MTKADLLVERGATRLQQLARKAAQRGDGIGEWLSEELNEDAAFLRRLKPSLIAARARGERPAPPPTSPASPSPEASSPKPKKEKKRSKGGGPSPILIVGAAFAAGILIAKVVDWRGHAHPRD
ncbi:MAG TPA: hypothetical protein VIW19_04835 [Gaiellaceae bacterium]|jgi:hypothetical protein